ncbi:MAG: radical SAM family heme chaperone HemW [Tannerella sp.]|jgi:oxygen-independent coproporphyrinogen-3 oxidase|nr:radical SAM family heme chaperone HemW [Tannerella sp.]
MAGIYIHIPFCKKRCIYCDFYSATDLSLKDSYVSALLQEIKLKNKYIENKPVHTIYFGGGTPSLLPCRDFCKIFNELKSNFQIVDLPEITLEANPDDLSETYISELKMLPVNRLSIGVQSFDDDDLMFLNRRHTTEDAINAVKHCKNAGFDNISIDLIYGIPRQTVAKWKQNIDMALSLNVQHISAYALSFEEGTQIYNLKEKGQIQPVDDELNEMFFKILVAKLTRAGYIHYEISNFAGKTPDQPHGILSKHNSSYWNGAHFLGLGAAAHSCNGETRSWNISSVTGYIQSITEKHVLPSEIEFLDERMKYNEYIITRLRTMWGITLNELEILFGKPKKQQLLQQCEKYIRQNKLTIKDGNIRLTESGIFISDLILRDLIVI